MATKEPTPPEGFERVDPSGSDDGEQYETKELDPGDSLQGRVIDILDGEGDYGPWYRLRLIDTETGEIFDYFAEDDVKKAVTQGDLVEGNEVYIEKEEAEEEYAIDGRKGTYYPVGCWIGGA
jgi:hypothetical protein